MLFLFNLLMDNIKFYSGNLFLYMDNWKSSREGKSDIKIFLELFVVYNIGLYSNYYNNS